MADRYYMPDTAYYDDHIINPIKGQKGIEKILAPKNK